MIDRLITKRTRLHEFLQQSCTLGALPRLLVCDVMTPLPCCVSQDTTVLEVVKMFHDKQFRHLLVVEGRRLVGVLSDRDVLRCFNPHEAAEESYLSQIKVGDVMSRDVLTISGQRPISEAVDILVDNGVNCLPVVDDEVLVGIITSTDFYAVLQALIDSITSRPLATIGG
ncbi:MAG: CBS domain-containing protein [Planctomycetes bacterium]|nr:CBS domain-containing protein [Planctomycetota bacterium]